MPSATSITNGIKEHKVIVETAVNKTVNNGITERKNSIETAVNKTVNNGITEQNAVNVTNQGGTSNEKGFVFVPPFNIKNKSRQLLVATTVLTWKKSRVQPILLISFQAKL